MLDFTVKAVALCDLATYTTQMFFNPCQNSHILKIVKIYMPYIIYYSVINGLEKIF